MHIVTGKEMYAIDRETIENIGLDGMTLMENAGRAVSKKITNYLKKEDSIAVMVGTGNNGGDGFVIARTLLEQGFDVDVWLVPPREKMSGDAAKHLQVFENAGHSFIPYENNKQQCQQRLGGYAILIDALLGLGLHGALRSPYQEIISEVNRSPSFVIAVDIPSGIPADGGDIVDEPVKADATVTLQCPKTGAFTYPSADYYGKWETVDIGIPKRVIAKIASPCKLWQERDVKSTLPERDPNAHKGTHGKGLLIAGSQSMPGAAVITAKAGLRGGLGLLNIAAPDPVSSLIASQVVEATHTTCPTENGFFSGDLPLDVSFDGVAIGPGIGRAEGSQKLMTSLLSDCEAPLVIDADGLYHLQFLKQQLKGRSGTTILTPHPGEMAQLFGCSVRDVQQNRFAVSREFAQAYGVYLVLKGPYTIVTTPGGKQFVNPTGNVSLAKGGTGDALTGFIFAFLLQHESIQAAISNAVYLHGRTADILVENEHTVFDVLATDLIEALPKALKLF